MAISKGIESKDSQSYKRYIGIAPMFIKAVNPNKTEHEEIFSTTLNEDPVYVTEQQDNEGTVYKNARISVVFKPDEKTIGFEMPYVTMALFIQNRPRYNSDKTKVQIIDKYGRTSWATVEEVKNHKIPYGKNGQPLNIDSDYRPAFVGEEDLTNFVKTYLCIPEISFWNPTTRTWGVNEKVKPEECECRFDNLKNIFNGDFSEIQEALSFQPTNKVKVMLGVRSDAQSGRLYQSVYTKRFVRANSNNYSALEKEINNMITNAEQSGYTLNTEYSIEPVHEYVIEPTVVTPSVSQPEIDADDPFSLL